MFCIQYCIVLLLVHPSEFCVFTSPAGGVAKYCDECVCLCVCLFIARISPVPHARSLPIFVRVAYVRGSVLLRHVYDRPHFGGAKRG